MPPERPNNMNELRAFLPQTSIAYFTMEVALRVEVHTYSGGLGVLAGDTVRSCADLELPVVFISLLSRAGYFRQEIDADGRQIEHPDPWDIERVGEAARGDDRGADRRPRRVGAPMAVRAQLRLGYTVPVLLLDTDLEQNDDRDRKLTHHLYGGDEVYRLKQELLLGVGGVRILEALGFEIGTYHLNEGHAAFATIELLKRFPRRRRQTDKTEWSYDADRVRDLCVFTTHTPVEAGHDRFSYDLVDAHRHRSHADRSDESVRRRRPSQHDAARTQPERLRERRRAEARDHSARDVSRASKCMRSPTACTWGPGRIPLSPTLYQSHYPQWKHEPEVLVRADQLPDDGAVGRAREGENRPVQIRAGAHAASSSTRRARSSASRAA